MVAVTADFLCQHRITGPNQCGQQRQQVPDGVQLQLGAVEADKGNPGHGHYKANEKAGMGLFLFQKQMGQDGREKRSYGDNHPDIGGHCVGKCDIFQQIVKAYSTQARCGKGQFLQQGCPSQTAGVNNQQCKQSHNKAKKQYFYWLEVRQQNFGGDKGRSPNDDREQGGEMARCAITLHAAFPPYP